MIWMWRNLPAAISVQGREMGRYGPGGAADRLYRAIVINAIKGIITHYQ
jgi:hypothetical protein